MPRRLDFDEHFEWSKDSTFRRPWNRKFLNQDFLKNEKARIEKATKWRSGFIKANEGDNLDSISLFVHPVKNMYEGWSKPVYEEVGNYILKVLSPLKNDNQMPVMALFAIDEEPEDFSFIKMDKAEKKILFNEKVGEFGKHGNFAVVEDYSYIEPDERFLVVDVDYEEGLLGDILKKNMGYDDASAKALESPTLGSPTSSGGMGGIGMTSFDQNMQDVNKLFEGLERAVPFEYSPNIKPPKSAENGRWVDFPGFSNQKVEFKVAEKVMGSTSTVSSRVGNKYGGVVGSERKNRMKSQGEYSYLTSMNSRGSGTARDVLAKIRDRFTESELKMTDPTRGGELSSHIQDFKQDITNFEDLKLNTVYARQRMPSANNLDMDKWEDHFRDIWSIYSTQMGLEYDSRMFLTANAKKTLQNAVNVSQSIARMKGKEKVTDDIMGDYMNMFEDQVERFVDHPVMEGAKKERKKIRKEDIQNALRQLLTGNGFTKDQIWDFVKNEDLFKDRANFEDVMKRLEKHGYIYQNNGKWFWA